MKVISSATHVCAMMEHVTRRSSVAEADEIGPERWWIARVKVTDDYQGQGIGSQLLTKLVEACVQEGAKIIEVTPGGYGSDPERLMSFYKRHGFKADENEPGLLVYKVSK